MGLGKKLSRNEEAFLRFLALNHPKFKQPEIRVKENQVGRVNGNGIEVIGGQAHPDSNYVNLFPMRFEREFDGGDSLRVLSHEMGHILEQRARGATLDQAPWWKDKWAWMAANYPQLIDDWSHKYGEGFADSAGNVLSGLFSGKRNFSDKWLEIVLRGLGNQLPGDK